MQYVLFLFILWAHYVVEGLTPVAPHYDVSIPAPIEKLKELNQRSARQKTGSKASRGTYMKWFTLAIEHIRYELAQNLPHPVDVGAAEHLKFQLGIAADMGDMPSFASPGARSGYALDFFCRVRRLSDTLLLHTQADFVTEALEKFCDGSAGECRLTSIGGGPGYDYVGFCLLAMFMNERRKAYGSPKIRALVFDYEAGWGDIVAAMDRSTNKLLSQIGSMDHSCMFGGTCDITASMVDPMNQCLNDTINSTNVFICQYCVAENANRLYESDYIFFRDLFNGAHEGALFIFTETTFRLWPEFVGLVREGFDITLKRNKTMILRKRHGAQVSAETEALCHEIRHIAMLHKVKVCNGPVRQIKKTKV